MSILFALYTVPAIKANLDFIYYLCLIANWILAFYYCILKSKISLSILLYFTVGIVCDFTAQFTNLSQTTKIAITNAYMPCIALFVAIYLSKTLLNIKFKANLRKVILLATIYIACRYNLELSYNIEIMTFCVILILLMCMTYYMITINQNIDILKSFDFWFFSGVFFWSTFFLFRMIMLHYFYFNSKSFFESVNFVFTCINILTYLIYLIGFRCLTQMKL